MARVRRHIIVFTRLPVKGRSKTRLARSQGGNRAYRMANAMLRRTIMLANSLPGVSVSLNCAPHCPSGRIKKELRHYTMACRKQVHGDLGARMLAAFSRNLQDYDQVLLMGTDCPELRRRDLMAAFRYLQAGTDIVLGPARDGGYVLIGMQDLHPEVFADINWGSSNVLEQTRQRITTRQLLYAELPVRTDIDTGMDISRYRLSMARR